nr:MAG: RNA-dependent RNA polymerase [Crogonang virus 134]
MSKCNIIDPVSQERVQFLHKNIHQNLHASVFEDQFVEVPIPGNVTHVVDTILTRFVFRGTDVNATAIVEALLTSRIDSMDGYLDQHIEMFLHSDDKLAVFTLFQYVFWDGHLLEQIVLPYEFRHIFDGFNVNLETGCLAAFERCATTPMEDQTVIPDVGSIVNILSYQEVMATLKPITTVSALYAIWTEQLWSVKISEILKLMEAHGFYWTLSTEKLMTCVDTVLTLLRGVDDVPELFKNFVSGEDANSVSPSSSMQDQSFKVSTDGFLQKSLEFCKKFGLDFDLTTVAPTVAMLSVTVVSIAMLGFGETLTTVTCGAAFAKLVSSLATSCRDWKIVLSSLESTWKFLASGLGQFLGFTYQDEKTTVRCQLIDRIEELRNELQNLEETKFFKFKSLSDPKYFISFHKKFVDLEKLINDMMRSDQNLAALKLQVDNLKTRFENIKEEFQTLFHGICGKQQPTVVWIGSAASGIGKTTCTGYITSELSLREGRELTKYVRNPMEAYWSSYVYQDIVHMRDFGQSTEEQEHIELINIYDPAPYQLPMGDVSQKGRQFKSRFVLIDSNQLYIRRSKTTQDPRKLDRRRDFLLEAHTDFPDFSNGTKPSKEQALKHLILHRINPIGKDAEDEVSHVKCYDPTLGSYAKQSFSDPALDTLYTMDGRDVLFQGTNRNTVKFDSLIDEIHQHEAVNNAHFQEEARVKYESMLKTKCDAVMQTQSGRPAVSYNTLEEKKIVVLRGPAGCGKTFTATTFRGRDPEQEEFTHNPNIRKRVLLQFNQCTENLVLTTNPTDYKEWIAVWENCDGTPKDEKVAFERRCMFIDFAFKKKPSSVLGKLMYKPEYFSHSDIENDPSGYARYVSFRVDGDPYSPNNTCWTYSEILELISKNLEKTTKGSYTYFKAPRFQMDENTAKNLVKIDMKWSETDDLCRTSNPLHLASKIHVVKSEFSTLTLMRSFRHIVCDVFKNYTLNPSLEAGIVQLNSLRVDSPMEFDCLVKMEDCSFILTTDDENKLVFCIADENYNYSVEDGKVFCYFKNTKLWEETGPVALWYQHLLRNVEKIHIKYECVTPPSAKFVQYCDHFLNFLKTMGAGFALYNLCKPRTYLANESLYNIYDYSMKKSETLGSSPDPDDYRSKTQRTVRVSRPAPVSPYKVKGSKYDESMGSHFDPDDVRARATKCHRNSDFKVVREYKVPKSYSSEASVDVNAFNVANIVMEQNYPLKIYGQHVAWAQGIFADVVVTVGHIQEGVQIEIKGRMYDLELLILFERDEKAIFRVLGLNEHFRDIRGHLQRKSSNFSYDGLHAALYTWDTSRTTRVEKPIVLCEQRQQVTESGVKFGNIYQLNSLAHIAPIQTAKGWCGSPLILVNPSIPQKLLGLHTAADNHQGLSSIIYRSDFNPLIDMDSETFYDQNTTPARIRFVEGNVFDAPDTVSLVHCVAQDMKMSAGIAVEFKKRFKGIEDLRALNTELGSVAVLAVNNRYIYNLVTKRVSSHKPTIETLKSSLKKMADHVKEHQVTQLAMPMIASGLDKLDWDAVLEVIKETFYHVDVDITIYKYTQLTSEDATDSNPLVALEFQQVVLDSNLSLDGLSPYITVVGKPGIVIDGNYKSNTMNYCNQTQIWPSPFKTADDECCQPAILSTKDPRCNDKNLDLITVGVNKFGRPQPVLDLDLLDECYDELAEHLLSVVRESSTPPKILSYLEAFNGWTACVTSPSMNFSAGPGYPHTFECGGITRKSTMFTFNVEKNIYEFADAVEGEQLKSDCEAYEQFLKHSDATSCVVYVPQLKDEVRPMEKIAACSTRVFLMGPTYHSILWKRYYGAAQALLTLTNIAGPFKIGIDPASTEFSRLYEYLAGISDVGMTGDYSGFDTCHPHEYLKRNAGFYNRIYKALDPNWTQEHDLIRNRLANQELKPLVLLNGTIVQLPGGNMSGGPDTGGRNNITGCVNMRYAWKILALKHCPEKYDMYDSYTRDAVFGDDLVKTIHPSVVEWYNPVNIRDVVVSIGFKITSAEKSKEICLEPLKKLSFLKRNFSELSVNIRGVKRTYVVGALEDTVFVKMLNWCKTTKRHFYRVTDPVKFDSTIVSTAEACLSEACLKGEEFYNDIKTHIITCATQYGIKLPIMPTFRQAFYRTYFREQYHPAMQTINIDSCHPLHPDSTSIVKYGNKIFKNFSHVFDYARVVKINRFDLAERIVEDPNNSTKISFSTQVSFNQAKLAGKLLRKVFPNIQKIDGCQQFALKTKHPVLGKNNLYSALLTNYAKDPLMATESKIKTKPCAYVRDSAFNLLPKYKHAPSTITFKSCSEIKREVSEYLSHNE